MAEQQTARLSAGTGFPPTVCEHTRYKNGVRLHTIDPDPDRDIDVFDDERPPRFVGDDDDG